MNILSKSFKYMLLAAVIAGCSSSEPSMKARGEDLTNADMAKADTATAGKSTGLKLTGVDFDKKTHSTGRVVLSLSNTSAFELKQTTPTEYVLLIPGARANEATKEPQIALAGAPGIRTVRVTESDANVAVRMFVDDGISLLAKTEGRNIVVTAFDMVSALNSKTRGQLSDGAVSPFGNKRGPDVPSQDGSKVYTGNLISVDLQDADIDNALRIIAEVSRLNIIASEEVRGKVTLRLVDVPWDQALDVILKTNGLDQVAEGSVIRIAPVGKLRAEREALLEAKKAAVQLEELQVAYYRISYARAAELVEQVQSVLSERGTVSVDDRTNQLIIKDIQEGQKKATYLVGKLDLRTPQILLETQIVEGQKGFSRDFGNALKIKGAGTDSVLLGKKWRMGDPNYVAADKDDGSLTDKPMYSPASNTGQGIVEGLNLLLGFVDKKWDLATTISAAEGEGKVRVISRPQIATVNNKPAEIKSTKNIYFRNFNGGVTINSGSGSGGSSSGLDSVSVGITLSVTPQASPDYYVLMDVKAQSSTLSAKTVQNSVLDTVERNASSTVLVESGSTFALGGVYRVETSDSNTGVPYLKDVPVLGWLFRSQSVSSDDEELVFFITPHIVEGSFDEESMKISR